MHNVFFKDDQLSLYLLQYTVLVYTDTCAIKLPNCLDVLLLPLGDMNPRTSMKGDFEACIISDYLFPENLRGTCAYFIERQSILLCFALLWSTRPA